jgi:hypothetical protein
MSLNFHSFTLSTTDVHLQYDNFYENEGWNHEVRKLKEKSPLWYAYKGSKYQIPQIKRFFSFSEGGVHVLLAYYCFLFTYILTDFFLKNIYIVDWLTDEGVLLGYFFFEKQLLGYFCAVVCGQRS